MKKLVGVLLVILFLFSVYTAISKDMANTYNEKSSSSFVSIVPQGAPDKPKGRGL